MTEPKTNTLRAMTLRLRPAKLEALERRAAADRRKPAEMARLIVEDALDENVDSGHEPQAA